MTNTKLVQVSLGALTRVGWGALVEVPADFDERRLSELSDKFYDLIDGTEFQDDNEFWDKGSCYTEDATSYSQQHEQPSYTVDADMQITPKTSLKRYELQIGVFIDAKHIDQMWEIFRRAGLHDILNQLDADGGYNAEVVGETEDK